MIFTPIEYKDRVKKGKLTESSSYYNLFDIPSCLQMCSWLSISFFLSRMDWTLPWKHSKAMVDTWSLRYQQYCTYNRYWSSSFAISCIPKTQQQKKTAKTNCLTGQKFGECKPWHIRPCTLGVVRFRSAYKTYRKDSCISRIRV